MLPRSHYTAGGCCAAPSTHIPVCHPSRPTCQINLSTAARRVYTNFVSRPNNRPPFIMSNWFSNKGSIHVKHTRSRSRQPQFATSDPRELKVGKKRRSIDKKNGSRDLQRWGQSANVCLLLKMEAAGAKYFTVCGLKRKDGEIYPIYSILLKIGMLTFF